MERGAENVTSDTRLDQISGQIVYRVRVATSLITTRFAEMPINSSDDEPTEFHLLQASFDARRKLIWHRSKLNPFKYLVTWI